MCSFPCTRHRRAEIAECLFLFVSLAFSKLHVPGSCCFAGGLPARLHCAIFAFSLCAHCRLTGLAEKRFCVRCKQATRRWPAVSRTQETQSLSLEDGERRRAASEGCVTRALGICVVFLCFPDTHACGATSCSERLVGPIGPVHAFILAQHSCLACL